MFSYYTTAFEIYQKKDGFSERFYRTGLHIACTFYVDISAPVG
ncbi:hypothetical protein HMPREF0860_2506 [Treponema socranskii subsp. socranskii VPI DR56BR1116 = ATCC 35536]|uniref:Uncharacterized protein n=1 Tax=Treponema socranskii subsp. socranskii VPI DR56BR1116 = ATCC 35536 TaxID=1125725 RepID=A0ABP2YM48_TRESO|nr:hypothetical protein HMPREF0860_2506 [Treponema socranskii subsp. socranskii VPI DR56BR1116 = ATCC 35536]